MKKISFVLLFFFGYQAQGQIFKRETDDSNKERRGIRLPKYVATKESIGMIGGIERGQYTFLELGLEKHWKKIRLVHARTIAANANLEYNFGNNVLGYNAGAWIKTGRVDLTYGFNLNYVTNFEQHRYGLGPQIGFRLLGLHFVNGYNFLLGDKEFNEVNKFYVGLRYYFPLRSKTTVVNVNKREPSEKDKKPENNNKSIFKPRPVPEDASPKKGNKSEKDSKSNPSKNNKGSSKNNKQSGKQKSESKGGKESGKDGNKSKSGKEPQKKSHWLFKD